MKDDNAGNLIRGLRQKLGMTQEEFAHEIAVTVSTVNRWENAHAEPSKLAWKAIQDLAEKRGLRAVFADDKTQRFIPEHRVVGPVQTVGADHPLQ